MAPLVKAHTLTPTGMEFYSSIEAIRGDKNLLGYVSAIERAWHEMKLNGVLCLEGRPILYLKEHGRPFHNSERINLQRSFWNQGVANVLVLADQTTVYIYSGLAKPLKDHANEDAPEDALVETLSLFDYISRIPSFYHELVTGHFYEVNQDKFDPEKSVDSYLLSNLGALRNQLIEGEERLEAKEAHAFIGRVLFLCYLLDRGIYSVGKPEQGCTGTMVLSDKLNKLNHKQRISYLYDDLFKDLKKYFNGNMFDQDLNVEKRLIRPSHLNNLIQFFGGHEIASGQYTLDFWAYDFKMIPVETISAIYQDFLTTEDRELQQKRGAIYTPRFLAEMIVDMALRDNPDAFNWSFLDPACGSGIFLVILFNRLAKHWILTKPNCHYVTKAKALKNILTRQIRGVDVEETACRITCFSLYLAYLDFFDPPDIEEYMMRAGEPLPKLLDYGDIPNRPDADIPVIHRANFLAKETLSGETFDCIIGNPPWVQRGKKQLAQKFVQKVPHFLRNGGLGCLLLPSKILQNQTDAFQANWLKQITLEIVLQLADYSFLLFQNASCPAIIARFRNELPQLVQHSIEFATPKFNRDGLRQGIITVNPSARTWIPLADILIATKSKTAPIVWKRRLWGTPRDQKLLDFLQSLSKLSDLAGRPQEDKRWIKGQGFQPNTSGKSKNPKQPWWKQSALYVSATASCWNSKSIILDTVDCEKVGDRFSSLHRSRDPRIYRSPLVLVSQGFNKVAFCDFDVLFQDSLQSIAGPPEDAMLLKFLTAYLRSNLARYFLFHTAANWGSERDKVHLTELLRVPFPLPDDESVSPEARQIVGQVIKKMDEFQQQSIPKQELFNAGTRTIRKQRQREQIKQVDSLQNELEPLICRYFGLSEQEIMLIEDTIHVFEPSSTPTTWRSEKIVTLNPVENTAVEHYANRGLEPYADTLSNTLNNWAQKEGSNYRIHAEGGTDDQTGLAIIKLSLTDKSTNYRYKSFSGDFVKTLKTLHSRISKKQGKLVYERDILFFDFEGKQIYIVRPNILFNWTRTAALNDAAKIYGEIILSQRTLNG